MRTLEEVRGACRIDDDGCWIWAGAVGNNVPRIYAPDWTLRDGAMSTQCGRRAVWHIQNPGCALSRRLQVFGNCGKGHCVNPACSSVGPKKAQGVVAAKKGWLKGKVATQIAARRTGRARSDLTQDAITEIQSSSETGEALAIRLGLGRSVISKVRRGQALAFLPLGGVFAGLGSRQ